MGESSLGPEHLGKLRSKWEAEKVTEHEGCSVSELRAKASLKGKNQELYTSPH